MYAVLKEAISATNTYVQSFSIDTGERENDYQKALEAIATLANLHDRKRLFLPQSTAEALDPIIYELKTSFKIYAIGPDLGLGNVGNRASQWQDVIDRLGRLYDRAVKELEHEFRVLLGDRTVG